MPTTKSRVAFVGIGVTPYSRTPDRPLVDLEIEACRLAAEDAGIDSAELDGISIQTHFWPPPETEVVARALGMKQINFTFEGHSRMGAGSIRPAAEALDRGDCAAIVVCKALSTIAPVRTPLIDPETLEAEGNEQFEVPYGVGFTVQRVGFDMRRYMHRFNITEEQIGWVALVARENSIDHPMGYQRKPLNMEDYLASRWIADPVRLLDCDMPVNGAAAWVMTREDRAKTLRHHPVYVTGFAEPRSSHPPHDVTDGISPVAQQLYADTGVKPSEIDLAYPYDGFSFWVPVWLEMLGLVKKGEGGAFIDGGQRIRRDGELPVNTHGGSLSHGRLHGQVHITEAVDQLRGTAGLRRVAREPKHALVTTGLPNGGHVAILSNQRP